MTALPTSSSSLSTSFYRGIPPNQIFTHFIQAWSLLHEGPRQAHLPNFFPFFHSKIPLRSCLPILAASSLLNPLQSRFHPKHSNNYSCPVTNDFHVAITSFDSSFFLCTSNYYHSFLKHFPPQLVFRIHFLLFLLPDSRIPLLTSHFHS